MRSDEKIEGYETGAKLRDYAENAGMETAKDFLTQIVEAQNNNKFFIEHKHELTARDVSNEMTISYQAMANAFIVTFLRTVQKTHQLIAATGLLTSEGIPWEEENFEPEEVLAEADRLIREEQEQEHEQAQDKGSY